MDILFWKNLKEDLNKSGNKAAANMSIDQFNKVYNDVTMFHYFADDFEVIDWVYNQYKKLEEAGTLPTVAKRMPLLVLNPGKKGMTALDWALAKQKQTSFLKLIDLIQPFREYCITKMMLPAFPAMLQA